MRDFQKLVEVAQNKDAHEEKRWEAIQALGRHAKSDIENKAEFIGRFNNLVSDKAENELIRFSCAYFLGVWGDATSLPHVFSYREEKEIDSFDYDRITEDLLNIYLRVLPPGEAAGILAVAPDKSSGTLSFVPRADAIMGNKSDLVP